MGSIDVCWKLAILPRRALVLPTGKNLARNTVEHLLDVSTASLSLQNHYFTFPTREKENRQSLIASGAMSLMTMVSHSSRKCCR
jgi:hypothetical protein